MIIYCPYQSPRLSYVLDFIFLECFDIPYTLSSDKATIHPNEKVIEYNQHQSIKNSLFIPSSKLLFEQETTSFEEAKTWFLQPLKKTNDYLSMIFYCLSRYEEYNDRPRDTYGRFPSSSSILEETNLLQAPVVDMLVAHIQQLVKSVLGIQLHTKDQAGVQMTFDIDQCWLAKHIPIKINIARFLKQAIKLDFSSIREHEAIRKEQLVDPFDIYNILNKYYIHKPLFFFLFAQRSTFDKGHNPENIAFRKHIETLAEKYACGLHPSMESFMFPNLLKNELKTFTSIPHVKADMTRQHYLAFKLPSTFQKLVTHGILHEYSMGYADNIGYRAGTGRSFLWFDLSKNEPTELRIHPFQIMDVSLKKYLKLSPENAILRVQALVEQSKKYKTPLRVLWHNSSFYPKHGWEGWEKVFEYLLNHQRTNHFD